MNAKNVKKGDWLLMQIDHSDTRGPTATKMMVLEDLDKIHLKRITSENISTQKATANSAIVTDSRVTSPSQPVADATNTLPLI